MSDEHSFNHNQQQAISLAGQIANTAANFLSTVGFAAWANRIRPVKIEIKQPEPDKNPALVAIPEAQGEQAGYELGLARSLLEEGVPVDAVRDRIHQMDVAQRANDSELAADLLVKKAQGDIAYDKYGEKEAPKAEKKARLVK
jgi:hypothetical protein